MVHLEKYQYHPLFGVVKVPRSEKIIKQYIRYATESLNQRYDRKMQAYKDCLEQQLDDMRRRKKENDENAV